MEWCSVPVLSVWEASRVLNCCRLACMRLERPRITGIVWDFLSEEKALDTQDSWHLQYTDIKTVTENNFTNYNDKCQKPMKWPVIVLHNMGQYSLYFSQSFIIHYYMPKSKGTLLFLPIYAPLTGITKLNQRNPVQNITSTNQNFKTRTLCNRIVVSSGIIGTSVAFKRLWPCGHLAKSHAGNIKQTEVHFILANLVGNF